MKKVLFYLGVTAAILLSLCGILSAENNVIIWHHADFPPAFILRGDDAGAGYCNSMEKDVIAFLKEYEHQFIESNYKRVVESIKNEDNICCASLYKTAEREKFTAYSEPLFIGFSNGIIIPKEKVGRYEKYVTPEKSLDIKLLMDQETTIKIGIISGRNYGPVEEIIAPYKKTEKIYERSADDSKGLVKMLMDNRIDMILALPMEIAYTAKHLGLEKEKMVFFPMKDGEQYTVSYMACPGNEWGKQIIEKINGVIKQKRPVFAKYYRDWLDESSAKTYNALVEKIFGVLPAQ